MALQQVLQDDTQRPPDFTLEEQVLLHLRYVYLVAEADGFASLAGKVNSELSISRLFDENPQSQLERLQQRCRLPPNGWQDSDLELIYGSTRYHELCKASTRISEQRDLIEGAMAKVDSLSAEDRSRYMQLFRGSCNPPRFCLGQQSYLDTPQNIHRLDSLETHHFEYKKIKAVVPTEQVHLGLERPNREAEPAPVCDCDELPLYAWVCVPKHLHEPLLNGQYKRRVGVIISVVGGGMVSGELLLCGHSIS